MPTHVQRERQPDQQSERARYSLSSGPGAEQASGAPRGGEIIQRERQAQLDRSPRVASLQAHQRRLDTERPAPVQRKLLLEDSRRDSLSLRDVATELLHRFPDSLSGLDEPTALDALRTLIASPINYGSVDIADEQHLDLLAYQVQQVLGRHPGIAVQTDEIAREQRNFDEQRQYAAHPDRVYRLALLGRGSSIAYYVNSLGEGFDPSSTLVIGEQDPWLPSPLAKSRGPGYINHTAQEILPHGSRVPRYDEDFVDRVDFARANASEIDRVPAVVDAPIESVRRNEVTGLFDITAASVTYHARKVIVGLGAGPHLKPKEASDYEKTYGTDDNPVLDLDAFMRKMNLWESLQDTPQIGRGRTVIVVGPNAGIDAVETAGRLGFHVEWLLGSEGRAALLPGAGTQHPTASRLASETKGSRRYTHVAQRNTTTITPTGRESPRLSVTFTDADTRTQTTLQGDYYVYAIGQNINAPGAGGSVLGDLKNQLEPIYDRNQALGEQAYETVLGLRTVGTTATAGLEVIGASAFSLAGSVPLANVAGSETVEQLYRQALNGLYGMKDLAELVAGGSRWAAVVDETSQLGRAVFELYRESFDPGKKLDDIKDRGGVLQQGARDLGGGVADLLMQPFTPDDLATSIVGREDFSEAKLINLRASLAEGVSIAVTALQRLLAALLQPVTAGFMHQVQSQPTDIVLPPQLGTVRSSVGALNASLPRYIGRESNFSSDDRNQLRVFMATRYPDLREEDARFIMGLILDNRRTGYHPYGYRPGTDGWPDWYRLFSEILADWQRWRAQEAS